MTLHSISREPQQGSRDTAPTLVLLHGVGSNEQDLMGLAPALDPRFRLVSLRAPLVLGPGSYGWYHVEFLPDGFLIDEDEVRRSLDDLLAALADLPPPLYLMGFSQGCVMALHAALREPEKFSGIVGMSGRIIESLLAEIAPGDRLRGLPVMVVHGTTDTVIPIGSGREIRDRLSALPVNLTYREYDMGHNVTAQSMTDINEWLTIRLASADWRSRVG
jgi:phospholipase/carboxylesterase